MKRMYTLHFRSTRVFRIRRSRKLCNDASPVFIRNTLGIRVPQRYDSGQLLRLECLHLFCLSMKFLQLLRINAFALGLCSVHCSQLWQSFEQHFLLPRPNSVVEMCRHVDLAGGETFWHDLRNSFLGDDDLCQVTVLPLGNVVRSVSDYDMWSGRCNLLVAVGALLEVGLFDGAGSTPFEGGGLECG